MWRAYFLPVIGTGTTADRGRVGIPASVARWSAYAAPQPGGLAFVLANVTAAEHAAIVALAGAQYLPFEDAGGTVLGPSDTFGQVSAANRATLRTLLEAQGVPTQQFVGSDPIRLAIQTIKRRFLARQSLGADDWIEALDTLVSALAPARRQAINAKLQACGYDTSTVRLTDTIGGAIVKTITQTVLANLTND